MTDADYRSPRCVLAFATAPTGTTLKLANAAFNAYCAKPERGLCLFHDHVRELPGGGVAVFFVNQADQLAALQDAQELPGWSVRVHNLIHARSPSGFDEQIAYTVHHYGRADWEALQRIDRPSYV